MGEMADYEIDRAMLFDPYDEPDEGISVPGQQKIRHDGTPVSTEKAVLWVTPDGQEHWMARSQILFQEEDHITISSWLADKKEISEYTYSQFEKDTVEVQPTIYDFDDDILFQEPSNGQA